MNRRSILGLAALGVSEARPKSKAKPVCGACGVELPQPVRVDHDYQITQTLSGKIGFVTAATTNGVYVPCTNCRVVSLLPRNS